METAKYQLDRTLFGMQEVVQDFQNAVAFDYQLRSLGRSSSSTNRLAASSVPIPLWDTMENARLRFEEAKKRYCEMIEDIAIKSTNIFFDLFLVA